jgi:hypothetical protein
VKKLCGAFTLVVALTIGATAVAESTKILSGASEASGASLVYDTGGARTPNVQACGTDFTGVLTVKQGALEASLVTTKTITMTLNSDCTEYHSLVPSTYTQVTYTRTAGSVNVYLEVLK